MADRQTGSEDDEFGLPEVRLRPRSAATGSGAEHPEKADPVPPASSVTPSGSNSPSDSGKSAEPVVPESGWEPSGAPRLLYILIPILTVLLALKGYFYFHVAPDKLSERRANAPEQPVPVVVAKPEKAPEKKPEPQKPAKPATVILSAPTGRFHVVIKSALDKESIMKEAGQLNDSGIECLVIPANATSPSNRLVLFSTENLQQAQIKADSLRPSFGAGIWVLKY